MKQHQLHGQFKSLACQAGFMPTYWLAVNSLGNDRTPEIIPGSNEGDGYA